MLFSHFPSLLALVGARTTTAKSQQLRVEGARLKAAKQQLPTAPELFDLRTRCAEMGETILKENIIGEGTLPIAGIQLRDEENMKKAREAVQFAKQFSWDRMSENHLDVCLRASAKNPNGRQPMRTQSTDKKIDQQRVHYASQMGQNAVPFWHANDIEVGN